MRDRKRRQQVTTEQKTAYATLHETADRLKPLVAAAKSSDHALTLPAATLEAIRVAVQALNEAQRSMEQAKAA
jgi:hypothetical protein